MTYPPEGNSELASDLKKLLSTLLKWAWLFMLFAVLGAGLSYLYSQTQPPVYEATTSILVTRVSSLADLTQSLSFPQVIDTYARMLSANELLNEVSQRVGAPVQTANLNIAALPNTQIIQLQVSDTDPARAARTADTMVKVLQEQNQAMQAARFAELEQSIETQINDTEKQIGDLQAQFDEMKAAALSEQVAQAKTKIDDTIKKIQETYFVLEKLNKYDWKSAQQQISAGQTLLSEQQELLSQQTTQYQQLEAQTADAGAQAGEDNAAALEKQMADLEAQMAQTRKIIAETQKEIEFLAQFETEQAYLSTLVEKDNLLKTQQYELSGYQNVYTTLLSSGEPKNTPAIDNLKQDLMVLQGTGVSLLSSREELKKQKLQNTSPIQQVRPAITASTPVSPRTTVNTFLGAAAGLIIALILVTLLEISDDTIREPKEVAKLLNAQTIGVIPALRNPKKGKGIYVGSAPDSPTAEAFRGLRVNLQYSARERPFKTILVTGLSAPGKTFTAANLAASLSQMEKQVMLVDANLRAPEVHQYAQILNEFGLSDWISADVEDQMPCIYKIGNLPTLGIMPAGESSANPGDLLGSEKMKRLLRRLSDANDYVIIDGALLSSVEARVLLGQVDGVVLVAAPERVRKESVHSAAEQIKRAGAHLIGVVIPRRSGAIIG